MVRPSRIIWRALGIGLFIHVVAIASLMLTTSVRKLLRARGTPPLHQEPPGTFEVDGDNSATVYVAGRPLFEAMLAAIDSAEHRVLFETYIIKDDAIGRKFKAALIAAAGRGVEVRVIYDAFANLVVPRQFFEFPPTVHVLRYPILMRGKNVFNPRNWGRDHRKILVVDDRIGFVGGFNVGDSYDQEWRDTHLSLTGPAVWDLENAFVDFWNGLRPHDRVEPMLESSWGPHVRSHRNVPAQFIYPIRGMYLEAIDRANSSIDITQAYFIPDRNVLEGLIEAARRGVRVRILLPKISNHVVADWLARGFFGQLLESGVEIWRYVDRMVHAKTMTIDGEWTTIGTANIDRLSLTGNYEINLEILEPSLAAGMVDLFERDLRSAEQLTLERWRARPWVSRVYETILRPLRPLL